MKKVITISWQFAIIFGILFIFSTVTAHQQVVVVPLGVKKCTSPTENTFTNSFGMTFNLLPAGTFTMGSPNDEPGRDGGETEHEVTLTRSFYIQTTEVTNKQWNTIIFDTGLGAKPSTNHTSDNYPVETVNWFEVAYFANRLSFVEGRSQCYTLIGCDANVPGAGMACSSVNISDNCTGYRLPTEAQWEYAARAGTTTAYANPISIDATNTETGTGFNSNLAAMGWYFWNRTNSGYADGTKPVTQQQANRWGLYDMHGNVYEWCSDWYGGYPAGSVTNPTGGASGFFRVMRGGSWDDLARTTRSADRTYTTPNFRSSLVGFRLALPQ